MPGLIGQSDAPSDRYSGRRFRFGHEIISTAISTADSSRAVVSYWQKYEHLVLVRFLKGVERRLSG